jgi:hypothetical protein
MKKLLLMMLCGQACFAAERPIIMQQVVVWGMVRELSENNPIPQNEPKPVKVQPCKQEIIPKNQKSPRKKNQRIQQPRR